jgi:Mce-associated membrane protein
VTAVIETADSDVQFVVEKESEALPAEWLSRAGAFAIDVFVGLGVLACALLTAWAAPLRGWLWWLAIVLGVLVFLATALNRLLLPAVTGWSLGRLLVGIAVVRRDGGPVGPWRLLIRDCAHLLDTLPLLLGWLWPLRDPRGRTFADLLTGTEVQRVPGERPERRRFTAGVLAVAAAVALLLAGCGYLGIYRPQAAVDQTRAEIAKLGPIVVVDMLSYQAATVQEDFAKAQALVTDGYRPQLVKQQEAVRKAGPVDNDYWVNNSAVLKATKDEAVMLLLLQGQRGEVPNQRLITATVQVTFRKAHSGQWQVADLSVLAKPNKQMTVEADPAPSTQPGSGPNGQPAPAPAAPASPKPAPAPNASPKPAPAPPAAPQPTPAPSGPIPGPSNQPKPAPNPAPSAQPSPTSNAQPSSPGQGR